MSETLFMAVAGSSLKCVPTITSNVSALFVSVSAVLYTASKKRKKKLLPFSCINYQISF